MNLELMGALNELEKERGISKEILLEAIEAAIVSAYKRNYGSASNLRVEMDEKNGKIRVLTAREVVQRVTDSLTEISIEDAKRLNPRYELDDVVEIEVTPRDFGRIAAQTAKQVVIQRIREAERTLVYEEYINRQGDIVTGIVQRMEHRNVYVDLGKIEAVLLPSEQMPGESYAHGMRIKVFIVEVRKTPKGPQVLISRTHPGLLKRLFELEVPEIHDGIVEIKAVSREPGARSKLAVWSHEQNVDPVGACVGPRGMRVQSVVRELRGEKVDVIPWDPDPERFVGNALSPAKVLAAYVDEAGKTAKVIVPDNQLSLAIGKEGQNARLAARLTGWKVDIKSEAQWAAVEAEEAAKRAAEEERRREPVAPTPVPVAVEEAPEAVPDDEGLAAASAAEGELVYDETYAEAYEEYPYEVYIDENGNPVDAEGNLLPGYIAEDGTYVPPDYEGEYQPTVYVDEEGNPVEGYIDVDGTFVAGPYRGETYAADEYVEDDVLPVDEDAMPVDVTEEEDGKKGKVAPAAKGRKSRASKKVEIQELVEEVEGDEPLPTLFGGEDAEPLAPNLPEPIAAQIPEKPASKKGKKAEPVPPGTGEEPGGEAKSKRVLKGLSALAQLDMKDK